MQKINNIFIICIIFTLSSCRSIGNIKTKDLYHADISHQTIQEISDKYGYYNSNWSDKSGNNIYNYTYIYSYYDPLVYIPVVAIFGGAISKNYEVTLVFNKEGKLIEKTNFFNKIKHGGAIGCGGCIKKIYTEIPLKK